MNVNKRIYLVFALGIMCFTLHAQTNYYNNSVVLNRIDMNAINDFGDSRLGDSDVQSGIHNNLSQVNAERFITAKGK